MPSQAGHCRGDRRGPGNLGPCWIHFYIFVLIKPYKTLTRIKNDHFNMAPTGNQARAETSALVGFWVYHGLKKFRE